MGGGGINNVTAIDIHTVLFPAIVRISHPGGGRENEQIHED